MEGFENVLENSAGGEAIPANFSDESDSEKGGAEVEFSDDEKIDERILIATAVKNKVEEKDVSESEYTLEAIDDEEDDMDEDDILSPRSRKIEAMEAMVEKDRFIGKFKESLKIEKEGKPTKFTIALTAPINSPPSDEKKKSFQFVDKVEQKKIRSCPTPSKKKKKTAHIAKFSAMFEKKEKEPADFKVMRPVVQRRPKRTGGDAQRRISAYLETVQNANSSERKKSWDVTSSSKNQKERKSNLDVNVMSLSERKKSWDMAMEKTKNYVKREQPKHVRLNTSRKKKPTTIEKKLLAGRKNSAPFRVNPSSRKSKPNQEKAVKLSVGSSKSNKKRKSWCVDASRTSRKKTTYRNNPKKISSAIETRRKALSAIATTQYKPKEKKIDIPIGRGKAMSHVAFLLNRIETGDVVTKGFKSKDVRGEVKTGGRHKEMSKKFQTKDNVYPECPHCGKLLFRGDERHHDGHKIYHQTCWNLITRPKIMRTMSYIKRHVVTERNPSQMKVIDRIDENAAHEKKISTCPGCTKKVLFAERGQFYLGAYWHNHCFRCAECDSRLLINQFIPRKDVTFCQACYIRKFEHELHRPAGDVLLGDDYQLPKSVLEFYPQPGVDEIHHFVKEGQVRFATMAIENDKNVIPVDWMILREELRPIDSNFSEENCDAIEKIILTHKDKHAITDDGILQIFLDSLMKNGGPSMGIMTLTYQLEDFGRISETFFMLVYMPEHCTTIERILYGSCKGKMSEKYTYKRSILIDRAEDMNKTAIINKLNRN